jgi:hypothetical protein
VLVCAVITSSPGRTAAAGVHNNGRPLPPAVTIVDGGPMRPDVMSDVFTRREATASGIGGRALTKLVRSGRISRVGKGVYRVGDGGLPDPRAITRLMKVVISHESAAAWYGAALPFAPTQLHVTAPRSRGRRTDCVDGVRLHRADLRQCDQLVMRGVAVTSPVRTLLDLARSKPLAESVAIADSMCRLGVVGATELEAEAVALPPGPGRPAAVALARLLDGRAESVFESMSRVTLAIAGLPPPIPQLNICDADGTWIARVDFGWPSYRVVLECDGFEFHRDRAAFERDRRRWNALTQAGWRVVIVTWHDVVRDPGYLVAVMTDLLSDAA